MSVGGGWVVLLSVVVVVFSGGWTCGVVPGWVVQVGLVAHPVGV